MWQDACSMDRLPGIALFDLSGRVALVTGATKGLGYAISAGLASAGADVVIVSRNADEAESIAKEIAGHYGHRAVGIRADVCNPDDVRALLSQVPQRMSRLD